MEHIIPLTSNNRGAVTRQWNMYRTYSVIGSVVSVGFTHGCDPITALRFNYHFEKFLSIDECIEKNRYFCIILINKKQNYAFILIFMPVGSWGDDRLRTGLSVYGCVSGAGYASEESSLYGYLLVLCDSLLYGV